MNKLLTRLLAAFAALLLLVVVSIGAAVWWNNRSVSTPDAAAMAGSMERGIVWLDVRRDEILQQPNAMLWWMVKEAEQRSGDPRLSRLFSEYRSRHFGGKPNMWDHLFDASSTESIRYTEAERLPYYNQHFLYALTCDELLGAQELVRRQNHAGFCDEPPYNRRPACVTHQLMGLRFMQRRQCGDQREVEAAIGVLQDKIVRQLTWDVRVVDVYLQRVLMLADSGATARIKPVWLQRVLDAQLDDGGWSGNAPIARLGFGMPLCFTQSSIGFRHLRGNFHATAQGVLLMSFLLSDR